MVVELFVNEGQNEPTDRKASDNSGFKKLAVQWLNKALCFVSSCT